MNSNFCLFKRVALGLFAAVALTAFSPAFAGQADDDLDSILNAPAMPAVHEFKSDSVRNDIFAQANALAAQSANMYRDVRYVAYPSAPDVADIKVVCTVTVRDVDSDQVLTTIQTAPRVPSGNPEKISSPLVQVSRNLLATTSSLAKQALSQVRSSMTKSVEVMVQIKRNGLSQSTSVVTVDSQNGGGSAAVTFVSKDEALPNPSNAGN
jgi:hypothetical protein